MECKKFKECKNCLRYSFNTCMICRKFRRQLQTNKYNKCPYFEQNNSYPDTSLPTREAINFSTKAELYNIK